MMIGAKCMTAPLSSSMSLYIRNPICGRRNIALVSSPSGFSGRQRINTGAQLDQGLKFSAFIETLPFDALFITSENAPADIGVQGGNLDPQQMAGFTSIQICFPI